MGEARERQFLEQGLSRSDPPPEIVLDIGRQSHGLFDGLYLKRRRETIFRKRVGLCQQPIYCVNKDIPAAPARRMPRGSGGRYSRHKDRLMRNGFEGVYAALATPMTAEQEVDYEALSAFVDFLIGAGGVHGLVALGSTGEYYALTAQERDAVVRAVLDVAAGRVPVLVGANAGSTRDVVAYSERAQQQGADGLLLAAPYYSLPTPAELLEHFREVDRAVDLPIMLYNYPGRTGVDMTPDLVERLAALDHVRYVKESSGNVARVAEILRRCGERITVFCGCDTVALESFLLGAVGWVGGVVNVLPKEHVRLFDLVAKKDWTAARELYRRLLPMLTLAEGGGKYTQFVKAACGLVGHPVGPPRQPLLPASAEEVAMLKQALGTFVG
jgi:4-hydroxy-tetrahydrodipicolinate synthase